MDVSLLKQVHFNEEGFMTNPNEWNKEIAAELAKQEGIETADRCTLKIIDFCRATGLASQLAGFKDKRLISQLSCENI